MTDGKRNCTVCPDPTVCQEHGLFRPIMGRPRPKCVLAEDEPGAAFVYKVLLRLAERQGVDVSELMKGDDE
jgi:hypothetical protein